MMDDQVGIIYLTAIIYSPTSAELKAGLEEEAVMCTSLIAERVIIMMVVMVVVMMMMVVVMVIMMSVVIIMMVMMMMAMMVMVMMMISNQVDCGSVEWLSCQEWCLAGSNLFSYL